jgi:hypothetical protein
MGWFDDVTSTLNPFDDAGGPFQGGSGGGSPPPDRGKVSRENFDLGGDPGYLQQFQGANAEITQGGRDLTGYGSTLANQSQGFYTQGGATAGRQGPQGPNAATYDPALGGAQRANMVAGNDAYGVAGQLAAMGSAPQGPSAAQAQLQTGTNQALASQLALARSGSGFGESANALGAAGANSAGIMAANANNAATLRASEDATFRQNQMAALGAAGNAYQAGRQNDLGMAQQYAQQGQYNANLGQQNAALQLQQNQLNDSTMLGLYGQGLQSQGMGLQGMEAGLNTMGNTQASNLAAAQAQQQGGMAYEQNATDVYGQNLAAHGKSRDQNQAAGMNVLNTALGAVSGLGGMAAGLMSDRRAKKEVTDMEDELTETYRALGGGK